VFIKDRVFVYWATYSQVVFQMKLIKAALDYGIAFDKLFMLSGQDYPLWSNDRIHQWVEQTKGKDMISGICIDSDEVAEKNKQIYRLCRPQTDIRWIGAQFNNLVSKTIRKTLKTIGIRKELSLNVNVKIWHLYKGSDYFAITLDTARFVFDTLNANKEIQEYFESSFAPSETCIHTILFNNPEYAAKANLHKGPYKSLAALTPLHHIVYDPIIKVWTNDDYDELISSDKMFARSHILDCKLLYFSPKVLRYVNPIDIYLYVQGVPPTSLVMLVPTLQVNACISLVISSFSVASHYIVLHSASVHPPA
jgi:hypothetical protein